MNENVINDEINEGQNGGSEDDSNKMPNEAKNFMEKLSELLKQHNITNHTICFTHMSANNNYMHFSDIYESAKLAAYNHKLLKEMVMREIN